MKGGIQREDEKVQIISVAKYCIKFNGLYLQKIQVSLKLKEREYEPQQSCYPWKCLKAFNL